MEIDTKETVNPEDFDSLNALEKENIPEELPLDVTWEEMYNTSMSFGMSHDYGNDNDDLPYYQEGNTQSLQDHLMWQVGLTPFSDTDTAIAISIIDAVDETGYLTVSLEDILATIGDKELTLDEVEAVLKRVQHFDPVGVASRNLRECLLVQLSQCAINTPYLIEARLIVADYLDLLGNHDYRTIIRLSRLKETALKEAIALIQSLDPRPGQSVVSTGTSQYVIPDVILNKKGNDWTVELNTDSLPHLKINQQYAALASAGGGLLNDNDSQYIRSNLQEAKWLIKSLASRHETLLKVARCIRPVA